MCLLSLAALPALFSGAFSGATAAGATAAAGTAAAASAAAGAAGAASAAAGLGTALQIAGTVAGIGGSLLQGQMGAQVAAAQERAIAGQRETEMRLAQTEATRTRAQFRTQIAQQTAELAARGVSLNSPTALLLGQAAGRELSFADQAIRAGAQARDIELAAAQGNARAERRASVIRGVTTAAGTLLTAAPQLWPELGQ